ncbi:response regulator transcription factor [Nonomuraea aurantiaca]|uniref:response regulator transcription factor n=1 Tax=Nonomuraea aurantiaca TaxID=2878562 RepID=UPI001CD91A51|nr:response regulator transcription factor [Nonomuraea aurantiaca]MCA2227575.1 response regulator transcription factor [Nonomuraea aurantiaca]
MSARILVVDDDPHLADLVVMAMRYEGFEAEAAGSGSEAVARVAGHAPDLLVLDIRLPDGSGLETCRRLRRLGHRFPIIFLTAMGRTEDKIDGLRSGGDDYLTKPFSLEELIARTHVVLRRTMPADRLSYGGLEIDDGPREVHREGRLIELNLKERALTPFRREEAHPTLPVPPDDFAAEPDTPLSDGDTCDDENTGRRRSVDAHVGDRAAGRGSEAVVVSFTSDVRGCGQGGQGFHAVINQPVDHAPRASNPACSLSAAYWSRGRMSAG